MGYSKHGLAHRQRLRWRAITTLWRENARHAERRRTALRWREHLERIASAGASLVSRESTSAQNARRAVGTQPRFLLNQDIQKPYW